ncbi:13821_t:CDS:2, partial [Gigaspora margarita]
VSSAIALDFSIPEMVDPIGITESDHKIIITHWKIDIGTNTHIEFAQYIEAKGKKLKDKIGMIEETLHLNKAWKNM